MKYEKIIDIISEKAFLLDNEMGTFEEAFLFLSNRYGSAVGKESKEFLEAEKTLRKGMKQMRVALKKEGLVSTANLEI